MHVVRYKGGLGNQMFQYAFMKSLENKGSKVGASLGFYDDFPMTRRFELDMVFEKIQLDGDFSNDIEFKKRFHMWKLSEGKKTNNEIAEYGIWVEDNIQEGKFQADVYKQQDCVYVGYWQSYKYFESIRDKLLIDLSFKEEAIKEIKNKLYLNDKSIVVHVRRGDYLQANDMYGGICTKDYYLHAIECIKSKIENPTFIFVSDDIEWVEKQRWVQNGIYVKPYLFSKYENWYDMAIISLGGHNIIANSSFSWWGAWLNQNSKKIVIAPKKWNNLRDYRDICPVDWIRI